jgi:hypothetical protein
VRVNESDSSILWRHHDLLFQTGDALAEQRDIVLFGTDEEFLVNSQVIDFYWLTRVTGIVKAKFCWILVYLHAAIVGL